MTSDHSRARIGFTLDRLVVRGRSISAHNGFEPKSRRARCDRGRQQIVDRSIKMLAETFLQLVDNTADDFDPIGLLTTLCGRCIDLLDVS